MPKKYVKLTKAMVKKRAPAKKRVAAKRRAPAKRSVAGRQMSVIQGRAGQVTYSAASHYHKRNHQSALIKDLSAPSMFSGSNGASFNVVAGTQNSVSFANIGVAQLSALLQFAATSSVGTSLNTRGAARSVILGATNEYLLNNSTETSATVDIYDITLKRDLQTQWEAIINGQSYISAANPESYWDNGLLIQQTVTTPPAIALKDVLNTVPTDSRLFNNYFKITKKTKVNLCPGGTHKHVVKIATNRLIDQLMPNVNMSGTLGFSTYTMFVVSGQPVYVTEGSGAGIVTTSPLTLNVVYSYKVKYAIAVDQTYTSSVASTLANPTAANCNFVSNLNGTLTNGVAGAPVPLP